MEKKYVMIEQTEGDEVYITFVDNPNDYESLDTGTIICLNKKAFDNMCKLGGN